MTFQTGQLEFAGILLTTLLIRLLVSLIVLGIAYLITGRILGLVDGLLARTQAEPNARLLVSRIIQVGIWVVAGLVILGIWGIELGALAAGVGLFSLAISIALQDVLRNWVVGLYLLIERPFKIGDRVALKDSLGVIEDVQLRVTRIRADDGRLIYIPNLTVFNEIIAVVPPEASPSPKPEGSTSSQAQN
ncbi:MAG: hypothetical protein C4315_03520 [Chloroflexota bacterium]|mgnify:CR=1 FL=1